MSVNYNDEKADEYKNIYEKMESGEKISKGDSTSESKSDDDGPSYEELKGRYETQMLNEDPSKSKEKREKQQQKKINEIQNKSQSKIENVYILVDWNNEEIFSALVGEDKNEIVSEARRKRKKLSRSDVRIIRVPVKEI